MSGKLALRYAGRQVGDALTAVLISAHSEAVCGQSRCSLIPCPSGRYSTFHSALPCLCSSSSFSIIPVLLVLGLKSHCLVLLWVSGGLRDLTQN